MSKDAKIFLDDDKLKEIVEIRKVQTNIQVEVGGAEAQKHLLLHRLHEYGEKLQGIMNDVEKEFGKGTLNLETGEFVLEESESASKDNGNT